MDREIDTENESLTYSRYRLDLVYRERYCAVSSIGSAPASGRFGMSCFPLEIPGTWTASIFGDVASGLMMRQADVIAKAVNGRVRFMPCYRPNKEIVEWSDL